MASPPLTARTDPARSRSSGLSPSSSSLKFYTTPPLHFYHDYYQTGSIISLPLSEAFRQRQYDTTMAAEGPDLSHRDPESITQERTKSLLTIIRCSNFRFPCISSRRRSAVGLAWWERIRLAQIQSDGHWWSRGVRVFKKIREWSEIVAGPRWKTFIRRFNRNRSGGARHGKFQYDPLSYSLNFEGENSVCEDEDDDFSGYRNFSARYAAVPAPLRITSNAGTSEGVAPVPVPVYG